MSYNQNYDPTDGTYRGAEARRPYAPACGAGELRGLLQRIADHIADADRRQQSALGDVQGRLARLAETWPGQEHTPGAQHRTFWPDPLEEELRGRYSASSPQTHHLQPQHGRSHYADYQGSRVGDQHDGWDPASAEALTRLYEPDFAADLHTTSSDPQASPTDRFGWTNHAKQDARTAAQQAFEKAEHARGQPSEAVNRLETRIADLAGRVEQVLAQLSSDGSAAARLASFETKLDSALAGLATRADIEQLRAIEGHIRELALHVERAHNRLARLDELEVSVTRLVEQTSDDHLMQLLDRQILFEPNIAKLAEGVAEHLANRDAFRDELGAGTHRLRELHELIEQFVSTQRQGDQQTAAALEVIQQAVLSLLDRMETLERTYGAVRADDDDDAEIVGSSAQRDGGAPRPKSTQTASLVTISERPSWDSPEIAYAQSAAAQAQSFELPTKSRLPEETATSAPNTASSASSNADSASFPKTREDFLAAARRAAQKASSEAAGASTAGRTSTERAASRGRRASGMRPLSGLVMAMLALVLAVGVGVTTYSAYKNELGEAWKLGRSVLELGTSGAGSSGTGSAAGGIAESPASEGTGAVQSPTPPSLSTDDQPLIPHPAPEDAAEGARTVTGLPGSVVIDTGMIASAARAEAAAVPAAFTGLDGEALPPRSRSATPDPKLMPPAGVGPLSLRLAAANGDPSAEFEVAIRLDEGRGIARDHKEAAKWYKRSAARGFAVAQYRLGTLYERGLGVAADRGRAMAWYKSAAEKGNLKAMHNFAVLSASGDSVDFEAAAHWFGEAAKRGLVDSQYNLAVLYETGRGVERDLKQAYKWFALAARAGDKEAVRRRDRVKWMLNAKDLEAAETAVHSWQPEPADRLVNDPRVAGEAWKHSERRG